MNNMSINNLMTHYFLLCLIVQKKIHGNEYIIQYDLVIMIENKTYWPILENYKACEEWWLYLLENEKRASMCTSKCHWTAAWLPLCDKVVRSWKPFPSSEVYEWINIEKSDTDDLFNLFSDDNLENDEYDIDEYDIDEYDIDNYDVDDNKKIMLMIWYYYHFC